MKRGELGGVQAASRGAASGVCSFFCWFFENYKCVSVWSRHMLDTQMCVEVRAQLARVGLLLPLCGLWASTSGHEARQQVPLPPAT